MPDHAAVDGLGHALVLESKLRIIMDQLILAGEDAALPSLGPGVGDDPFQHPGRQAPPAVGRQGVHAEDHLPGALLVVEGSVGVHLVPEDGVVGHQAIDKADQGAVVRLQQPEVIGIHCQPGGEILFRGGLGGGKTGSLHRRDSGQVRHGGGADVHRGLSFYFK